jgi:plastocyanin
MIWKETRFMSPRSDSDNDPRLSRRLALALIAGVGGALGISRLISADDDDNSGHGNDHDDDTDTPDTPDDEGKVAPLGTVPPGSFEVRIVDDDADAFRPGTISVMPGQPVTFVNLDDDPHTATGASFDTGIMHPGEQATVTFDRPGVHPFACQIHPVMTGVVEVLGTVGPTVGTPVASPVASPAAVGASFEVTIADFSFDPSEITVPAGSVVTWVNSGAAPHTASASDQTFDTGVIDPGTEASHTFAETGAFSYFCAFHPSMTGTVTVT